MDTKKHIGFIIKYTDINIKRYADEHICCNEYSDSSFTENHRRIIHFLLGNDDKVIFQKDIEEHFSISPATCSKMLKLMEKNGYIKRLPVPRDARLKQIHLTDKAYAEGSRIKSYIEEVERKLRFGISDDELSTFFTVLDKINNNAKGDNEC